MANFATAYNITAAIEGGYVNDPVDLGGETYKGISRKNWPIWYGWGIIDKIKRQLGEKYRETINAALKDFNPLAEAVEEFYYITFWMPLHLNDVIDQRIADEVYDTAVNTGKATSVQFLQIALNLLNNDGKEYPDLKEDGVIGPVTIQTLNKHKRPDLVLKLLTVQQGNRYIQICRNKPSQEKYLKGWLSRV